MKKFINLNELKMQKSEMQNVVGGIDASAANLKDGLQPIISGPAILLRYGIIALYGIITPRYAIMPEPGIVG